ncbi:MAG: L-seryl-tRNA(Sec) selenium transferase, partial [Chloroflexi bacterium]|nr:L-seryl-tRNA(Sec) selenium transferase [Chloroflexota bacterium]
MTMSNPANERADLSDRLRSLPSVDRVLSESVLLEALRQWPRAHVVEAVRAQIDVARSQLSNGGEVSVAAVDIADSAQRALEARMRPSLQRVINATGVVIHTNLGRAP